MLYFVSKCSEVETFTKRENWLYNEILSKSEWLWPNASTTNEIGTFEAAFLPGPMTCYLPFNLSQRAIMSNTNSYGKKIYIFQREPVYSVVGFKTSSRDLLKSIRIIWGCHGDMSKGFFPIDSHTSFCLKTIITYAIVHMHF